MAQERYDDLYDDDNIELDECFQRAEKNCLAQKTSNSGPIAPSNPSDGSYVIEQFMLWGDEVNDILRFLCPKYFESSFTSTDEMWPGLFHSYGDDLIVWIDRNDTLDGWILEPTIEALQNAGTMEDTILVIKGGSTYTTGGSIQGEDWDTANLISHNHQVINSKQDESGESDEGWYDGESLGPIAEDLGKETYSYAGRGYGAVNSGNVLDDVYTSNYAGTTQWRPYAKVGTLQQLDI